MTVFRSSSVAGTVVRAGLVAGTLDGLAATIQYYLATGRGPDRIFLYIASGAFGRTVYEYGILMVAVGVLFHYLFATGWSLLYVLLYPRVGALRWNTPLSGVVYGLVVWAGMNLVVIPLSALAPSPFDPGRAALAAAILIVCVGIPVATITRLHFSRDTVIPVP